MSPGLCAYTVMPGGRAAPQIAFVQGRLTKDEFDLRVGQALTSGTHGDLAALTADIPAGLTGARRRGLPGNGVRRGRPQRL